MATKHYAEFLYPGVIVSDSSIKEITENEYRHPETIRPSEGCFGFRVMARTEVTENGETLTGAYRNKSHWYYIGEIRTIEDVARTDGKNSILYRNMENNGFNRIAYTKFGQAIPMNKEDTVIGGK